MFKNLKIRTGLFAVLTLFVLALAGATTMGWSFAKAADDAVDDLNRVSTEQTRPLYETQVLLLRTRITLVAAFLDVQAGRASQAQASVDQAAKFLGDARQRYAVFQQVPKLSDAARKMTADLDGVFDAYVRSIDALAEALQKQSADNYVNAVAQARTADAQFEQRISALLNHTERRAIEINDASDRRYLQAETAAIIMLGLALILAIGCWRFISRQVLSPLKDAAVHFDRIASGDLTHRVAAGADNEIGVLFAALKRMQESLTRTVAEIRRSVNEINTGSAEIASGNTNLSSRTEEQAASLEETAASMEELATAVKQNTAHAHQANALAAESRSVAMRGGEAVNQVVQTMSRISDSSRRIAEIVSVIDGIAFQTNILALNAAVEAARAGEQGKGFAVVAGEVRSLAQRSAQAAREVKDLIEQSTGNVDSGAEQVRQAGETMQEIVSSVQRVTQIMAEITEASTEQSLGIDQINRAVTQMDDVTQQNAALVEEAAAAASSLEDQAKRLAATAAFFKVPAETIIDVTPQPVALNRAYAS
ncbi:Serine chemoreceptor protein [Achromobacter spanius]|uniref:methyl-accepting chemotaxis protein n=1 Tax=Achromobacter spanius TaxID=217203 RepID=UPI000C2C7501|nr:methyl-accepting chemotaxis protein [Achromobacter spanius]AUA54964.1 methyl-accepting chemotaxis protein [Achromobacter spanius]CAB3637174.1 Methyl-accepting chemotaxis protein I [Achromobacter spanius]VEE57611.1 Serine chemoreceptor protein [Achromobacter spanius]